MTPKVTPVRLPANRLKGPHRSRKNRDIQEAIRVRILCTDGPPLLCRQPERGPAQSRRVTSAIIFDVDGTLVDSVDLHALAWWETFREFGKDIFLQDIRLQIGKGADQLLPMFLSEVEFKERGEEISKRRGKIFKERHLPKVKAFPRVRNLFQRLLADGKKIALASSAVREELEVYKQIAEIADLIDTETSADDAERSKPHPDILEAALERLGDPPKSETLVIGDTPYDIEAAGKAGLKAIAFRCGGFPEETLRGAIDVYDSPADLLARYAGSPLAPEYHLR